jgi:transposase
VIAKIDNWKEIPIDEEAKSDDKTIFRGDTTFTPFQTVAKKEKKEHLLKTYRLVVTKEKRRDGQINLFTGEAFDYYGIITNDEQMSNEEIVDFYNQRGAREKEFDILKNDFGWNKMPFSRLDYNAVYLIVTAMCRNLYGHIISWLSKKYKGLSSKFRIKKFIFRFICIPAKWIRNSRSWKLRMYGYQSFKT